MLDYKDIIVKHFGLGMSGRQIAREFGISKSGVNDVLGAFKRCESLDFPREHLCGTQQGCICHGRRLHGH